MKASDAYNVIRQDSGELLECCDFGDFYGFIFGKKGDALGTAYVCVDKITGKVFSFSPFDDFETFDKGVQIPLSEVI